MNNRSTAPTARRTRDEAGDHLRDDHRGLDAGPVKRALGLSVKAIGTDTWLVEGDRQPHQVRRAAGRYACGCPDAIYGADGKCVHCLGVHLFRRLGPSLWGILRELVTDASLDRLRAP